MREVTVTASVSEAFYHRYEEEARREGVSVENLVTQTVNCLLRELEQEEEAVPCDPS